MTRALKGLALGCILSMTSTIGVQAETPFPSNPQTSGCSVDQTTFNSWFGGQAPVKGQSAVFADSVDFPANNTKCDFYKWSSQMFLWLSSSAGQSYVFDSVTFFDVSPEDANGNRRLISNDGSAVGGQYALRSTKFEEEIGETGQAGGGGVLLSQNNSIVYYGIHVNDVYAYFLSYLKNLGIEWHSFPDTQQELDAVVAYAASQGVQLPDADALTMELKTSWVDVSTISDPSQYLTISAEVPKYDQTASNLWPVEGMETKTLALVGMHIVGTVAGHPEMVWATIEHMNNAPDADYYYLNNQNQPQLVNTPSTGGWLFSPPNTQGVDWNRELAKVYGGPSSHTPICGSTGRCQNGDIVAYTENGGVSNYGEIAPSSTQRTNPWGSAGAHAVNGQIQDPENNAELISLNNDVLAKLPQGDVRANYFLSGAVWTQHGNLPTYDGQGPAFKQIGSLSLANSTMETYHQEVATSATTAGAGCFMCHSISGVQAQKNQGVELSHIFDAIQPISAKK